jgi:C_GCAxxG_C_C family probable redox protein
MMEPRSVKLKLQELEQRQWDREAIEGRCRSISRYGIPPKDLSRDTILFNRQEILDRVQRRAEEYNYVLRNCAKSTGMAVMEEFGLGNIEILRALSPFPGCGGTGWMCGGVTGSLAALGLYGGDSDLLNHDAVGLTFMLAQEFMSKFEREIGGVLCTQIHEKVVFGRYMDPGASPENMKAFEEAKGFEKCSLVPGIAARIASEIIIDRITET